MGQNEPENQPEKCFRISKCANTNRRAKLPNLLKTRRGPKNEPEKM